MDKRFLREPELPVSRGKSGGYRGMLLLSLVTVALFIAMRSMDDAPVVTAPVSVQRSWVDRDESLGAFVFAQMAVKQSLKAPSSAKFAETMRDDTSVNREGQVYTVVSWVDAQNSFGAVLRKVFAAKVEQVSDGRWKLRELSFVE
jgi:hypothetical protein